MILNPAEFNKTITPPTGPWASFPGGIGAPGLGTIPVSGGRRRRHTRHRKTLKRRKSRSQRRRR
jgi:hypothetical protein